MFKRAAKIIIYGLIVWFISPVLEVILPLPTENMVDGVLNLKNDLDQSLFKLLRFIVWLVFVALIFEYSGSLFSFVLPITKRYSTTKQMRRFQGVFAEVFIFSLLLLIVGSIFAAIPSYKQYDEAVKKEETRWKDIHAEMQVEVREEMQQNRDSVLKFIEANKKEFTVPFDIWPNVPSKTIDKYSIDDVINNPSNYQKTHTEYIGSYGHYKTTYDIRRTIGYQKLFKKQQDLHEEKIEIDSLYYRALNNEEFLNKKHEQAKEKVWAEFGSPLLLLKDNSKSYIWLILLITIILYIAEYFASRSNYGGIHESFLQFMEQGKFGRGGSARFAGLFEEWRTLYKNQKQGLFMGRSLYNPFLNIGLEDSRHMMTIAGSRGGKGATAIIPNLLLWEGSTLVIDPKGTNAVVTARRRKELGQKVHLIDPFNIVESEDKASFNPLDMLDADSPHIREQISIISEALVVPDQNQKEKHWDDGARTIIAGILGHLVSSPKYENPTLPMLRELLSKHPDDQAELWAEMSMNDGAGRLPMDAANRVIRGIGTNEISSIISNADKHTEWLSSPAMKDTLSSSSFSFADLKNEPTSIYLILPPQYLETHNRFLRLFVNLAISQMSVEGKAKVPVLWMLDEFLALGKMEEVEKAFGLMAGYNLIMWPFVQDLGRLKSLYGTGVNAFIANSRAIQIFGVADQETKEFTSEYIGEQYLAADKKRKRYNDVVKLRPPHEVALDVANHTNRQYILRSGKAPLVIEKVPYYDSAPSHLFEPLTFLGNKRFGLFEGLYDADPDYT